MAKPVVLTVDDDPDVLQAVSRDLWPIRLLSRIFEALPERV
jgi:hypothetical protein